MMSQADMVKVRIFNNGGRCSFRVTSEEPSIEVPREELAQWEQVRDDFEKLQERLADLSGGY